MRTSLIHCRRNEKPYLSIVGHLLGTVAVGATSKFDVENG
jgi:hypothetical protein